MVKCMARYSDMIQKIGEFDTGREKVQIVAVVHDPMERFPAPDEVVLASRSLIGNIRGTIKDARRLEKTYRKSDRRLARRISRNIEELEGLARDVSD